MSREGYDSIPLVPIVVAKTVCSSPYVAWEVRGKPDPRRVAEVERRRQAMTPAEVQDFALLADARCREAYESQAPWFERCIRAKTDAGLCQLRLWITHWLVAHLNGKEVANATY